MLLLCCLLSAAILQAQSFKLMRYDESYLSYKDSARTWYNRIKYLPLNADGQVYLSFGGEARAELAAFNNEDWGRLQTGHNNFLLQRYDVHADLHLGSRIRVFAQLRSAWETGRKNGPRPIDEDKLNIQNLFIDVDILKQQEGSLTLRVGRQEVDYGSGRLISVREGPNARLYFNGAKIMGTYKRLSVDAFVLSDDTVNLGAFDNVSSRKVALWGAYGRYILPRMGNIDFYYLGIQRGSAVFEEGVAKETRHTVGGRFWKYGGGFIYNLEGNYQFGSFGNGRIRAWTASADVGYNFDRLALKPIIGVRNDYISGDKRQGDGNLETFDPLYPKGGYFGFNPQIGPVNLIDLHPYASVVLLQKLTLQADVVFNWRFSLQDGVYRPSGTFNLAGSASKQRYIGTAFLFSAVYPVNKFLSANAGMQYFKTGAFIQDVIPASKDGVFLNARLAFKF